MVLASMPKKPESMNSNRSIAGEKNGGKHTRHGASLCVPM